MVIKLCKKCGGSGNRTVSVKPIKFKKCSKCGGNGGRSHPHTDKPERK